MICMLIFILHTISGHTSGITCARFLPGTKTKLATCGGDRQVGTRLNSHLVLSTLFYGYLSFVLHAAQSSAAEGRVLFIIVPYMQL